MFKNSVHEQKVAIVTGSSSGIGFETSLELARNGFYTYASMRDIGKSIKIKEIAKNQNLPLRVIQLDVNDENSVTEAIDTVSKEKTESMYLSIMLAMEYSVPWKT